jgi:hypothetical protein
MPKDQKIESELEDIILQATGIEVVVMPSPELGWTATALPVVSAEEVQSRLEVALPALRARYDLKSE